MLLEYRKEVGTYWPQDSPTLAWRPGRKLENALILRAE